MIMTSNNERVELCYCELTVRTQNILRKNGIKYFDELVNLSSREILEWENVGKKTLYDIRNFLREHNLSLKDETINPNVQNMILKDLPEILDGIRRNVNEAIRELRFFSFKLEQIAESAKKREKKVDNE